MEKNGYNHFRYTTEDSKRTAPRHQPEAEWGEKPRERVTVMPGKPDKSDTSGCAWVPALTGKLCFY